MEKNWLIRTKSNHILGPISKEKVVELYQNGSIKADDEVCTGNGYWFFIREDDMVSRFLLGNEVQGFNPISEAKDVLNHGETKPHDDITLVTGLNINSLKGSPPSETKPQNKAPEPDRTETASSEAKKKNSSEVAQPKTQKMTAQPVLKKQNYLQYILYLGLIALVLVVYYRKKIINELFQGEVTVNALTLMSSAHAQEDVPSKKKSSSSARSN